MEAQQGWRAMQADRTVVARVESRGHLLWLGRVVTKGQKGEKDKHGKCNQFGFEYIYDKELEVENEDLEARRKIGTGLKVWEFRQSPKSAPQMKRTRPCSVFFSKLHSWLVYY